VGKGTTVERLKIIQRSVNFKARNLLSGPEILPLRPEFLPLDKISEGPEIPEFSGGRKFLNFRGARNS
jgi:hypothetical protein